MSLPIPLLLSLSALFPTVMKAMKSDDKHAMEKIVDVAKSITQSSVPEQVMQLLETNGEMRQEFDAELSKITQTMETAFLADRQDARSRDLTLAKAGYGNLRADIMVVAAAMGLAGCLSCLVFYESALPGEAVGIISTVAGIFGACLKDAYAFEFGSSRGSKNKDAQVATLLQRYERSH
jgi:hypothetical protein